MALPCVSQAGPSADAAELRRRRVFGAAAGAGDDAADERRVVVFGVRDRVAEEVEAAVDGRPRFRAADAGDPVVASPAGVGAAVEAGGVAGAAVVLAFALGRPRLPVEARGFVARVARVVDGVRVFRARRPWIASTRAASSATSS